MRGGWWATARWALALVAALVITLAVVVGVRGGPDRDKKTGASAAALTFTPVSSITNSGISGGNQGFSVETADFAHGFLTRQLLARPLATLGNRGTIRIGGYTSELTWPAFGEYARRRTPSWAVGGRVDQYNLDQLKQLLTATGWRVTIALPVKSVVRSRVTYGQAIAEAVAAYRTLGSSLAAIEIGNEYDIVTRLTPKQYYSIMRRYYTDIHAAIPYAHIRLDGPSDGTPGILRRFLSAAAADRTINNPRQEIDAVTAHHYDSGRCHLNVQHLLSAHNYTVQQAELRGDLTNVTVMHAGIPLVLNETNSESGSGCRGVSNSYAASLWVLDYLLQATRLGIADLNFHTSTARVCGDFHTSALGYATSYRWYAAFCAANEQALRAKMLSASPLYYGIWAFRQIPAGQFVALRGYGSNDLSRLRAYGVETPNHTLTMVLINVQDPSKRGRTDSVRLELPGSDHTAGSAITLKSSAPGGLASTNASGITLGQRRAVFNGAPPAAFDRSTVPIDEGAATVNVAPGTARIITFPNAALPSLRDLKD